MNENIFLGSEIKQSPIEKATFSVLPVPYEKTVSYGEGTLKGPQAIIEASNQLETWDGFSNPSAYGIHTCKAVDCNASPEVSVSNIQEAVMGILQAGSMPVILGGEHTITQGVVDGYLSVGITDFGVIQLDAHADLRDAYEGDKYSHASVMKRVIEKNIPIYQLGVRAYCEEEKKVREKYDVLFEDAHQLVPNQINQIKLPKNFPKKVFITIDIDGFDPSVFPSTGTPVPGGLGWYQGLALIQSVIDQAEVIGFDVVEFSPIKDFHAYDFAASLLVYKVMGMLTRKNSK